MDNKYTFPVSNNSHLDVRKMSFDQQVRMLSLGILPASEIYHLGQVIQLKIKLSYFNYDDEYDQ